jgi:hypothetical protein
MFETLFGLLGEAARSLNDGRAARDPADGPPAQITDPFACDDDLPAEARELIAAAETAAEAARADLQAQGDRLRAAAEDEARAARRRADDAVRELEVAAARELAPVFRSLFDGLRSQQEDYARRGKLDEALAIRANLRQLRAELLGVRPDPGSLTDLSPESDGRSFLYEVAGRTDGSLWGANPYTLDSHLGTAAVHAGLVKPGLRAVIRVTVLASEYRAYPATESRGVASSEYHGGSRGFRLDAAA